MFTLISFYNVPSSLAPNHLQHADFSLSLIWVLLSAHIWKDARLYSSVHFSFPETVCIVQV